MYDVIDGHTLKNRRRFTSMEYKGQMGGSDGIRADTDGNIWSAAGWVGAGYDGVHIFAPDGVRIGMILLPENLRQPLLWRGETQPALHGRQPVPLFRLRRSPGRAHHMIGRNCHSGVRPSARAGRREMI